VRFCIVSQQQNRAARLGTNTDLDCISCRCFLSQKVKKKFEVTHDHKTSKSYSACSDFVSSGSDPSTLMSAFLIIKAFEPK